MDADITILQIIAIAALVIALMLMLAFTFDWKQAGSLAEAVAFVGVLAVGIAVMLLFS